MNLSSPEFLKNLKQRDHATIEYLIDSYHEALYYGAIKQKLGEDQAEEVVQETWSTFFEKIENFEGRSHIRTYLFGILYNKIKELWRSNKKYTQDDDLEDPTIFDPDGNFIKNPLGPSDWAESKEFLKILEEELEKLPYNQRMVFFLKEVQGEKTQDICNLLNISNTNLGVLIYRAKANLRNRLENRFTHE